MARTYKLSHFTKGTGASVEPIEEEAARPAAEKLNTVRLGAEPRKPKRRGERQTTALPPGHVRKKATGELGRVRAIDAKAGTATVYWLRAGATSTVPIASISRR